MGRRHGGSQRGLQPLYWLWCGCVLLTAAGVGEGPEATGQGVVQGPQVGAPGIPVKANPLDGALAWMYEARKAYAGVADYTCTLVKRENLPSNPEDNIIQVKFRQQPFSVYMRWLQPAKFRNQEVAYLHGRNRNMLRVHAKGLFKGLAGFVSVDVDDSRVQQCSRHNIYEAGMGYMIERTIQQWEVERKIDKTQVRMAEYEYDKKRCMRIETIATEARPDRYCYRSVLYIDKETRLPIRTENYDWPRAGGPADGAMLEMFSYVNLRLNAGLTDRDFDR